jgi:enduracididine biosynthesis enzyme MppP
MIEHALIDDRAVDLGDANLTELELVAERSGINLADGHARQMLSAGQQAIVERLPEFFYEAQRGSVPQLDREAQTSFLTALGQHRAVACAEVLSCYSSSVAMEILARSLRAAGLRRVGLIHPTFDNIPDILRGMGIELIPLSEQFLQSADPNADVAVDVMFVTSPNNPTGTVLGEDQLARWAAWCAARGVTLVLDTSFRGFDSRAMYDHYLVLDDAGVSWVVIEDTGKLFPSLDLKAGFLAFAKGIGLPLRRIYTDILLGVSPLILRLVTALAEDAASGGLALLHRAISANRAALRTTLADADVLAEPAVPREAAAPRWPDRDNRISVDRMLLPPAIQATRAAEELRARGVQVLPCPKFHWANPADGERFIRVALGRPEQAVRRGAEIIREYLAGWERFS